MPARQPASGHRRLASRRIRRLPSRRTIGPRTCSRTIGRRSPGIGPMPARLPTSGPRRTASRRTHPTFSQTIGESISRRMHLSAVPRIHRLRKIGTWRLVRNHQATSGRFRTTGDARQRQVPLLPSPTTLRLVAKRRRRRRTRKRISCLGPLATGRQNRSLRTDALRDRSHFRTPALKPDS